jgi:serine/threonine protein kinase
MKINCGTREYSSYESYSEEINIDQAGKSDIFSIGCILYNLQFKESIIKTKIIDEHSLKNNNNKLKNDKNKKDKKNTNKEENDEIKYMIEKGIKKEKECQFYSEEMRNYAIKLLNVFPEDRFNAKEALDDKWLNEDMEKLKEINYINQEEHNTKLLIELQTNFKGIDSLKRRSRFVID